VWAAIILLAAVAGALAPEFFRVENLQDVLRRSSILGIVTMGQVLVLMTGGLDISVAAVIGLTAVAIAESTAPGGPGLTAGILAAVLIAVGVGTTNGILVTRRRVPPFVATFGMFVLLEGARLAYTSGTVSGNVTEGLRKLGRGILLGAPWPTVTLVVLVVVLAVFVRLTVPGRHLVLAGPTSAWPTSRGSRSPGPRPPRTSRARCLPSCRASSPPVTSGTSTVSSAAAPT
jgi:ribose transport system permease protein